MRGRIHIDRENTAGDRAIIRTIDIEGLLSGTDQHEYIKAAVSDALGAPDACIVRAITDDGRCIYRQRAW